MPLEPGRWYVSLPGPIEFRHFSDWTTCIVAGPFLTRADAENWLNLNPKLCKSGVVWQAIEKPKR